MKSFVPGVTEYGSRSVMPCAASTVVVDVEIAGVVLSPVSTS